MTKHYRVHAFVEVRATDPIAALAGAKVVLRAGQGRAFDVFEIDARTGLSKGLPALAERLPESADVSAEAGK